MGKLYKDWQRLKKNPAALPIPKPVYMRMNRRRPSEFWRESFIAYLLDRKGFNIQYCMRALNWKYPMFKKKLREPDRLTVAELKKLSQLLNVTLFEIIALTDMHQDDDGAKYTAERYYQDMLKSRTVIEYAELKRLNALTEVNPAELEKALDEYREKYE